MVGFKVVEKTTPLEVIVAPPSLEIDPPERAEV
jgi:hypothetical protein